jgi:phosphohistidine phosphatase
MDKDVKIDAFISSPANRAITTATYFAKAYDVPKSAIIQKPELYHAAVHVFYDVIQHADDAYNSIAIFSHNPGITEFINDLEIVRLDDMPTCGIIVLAIHADSWKHFKKADKKLLLFDYPKAV